MRGKLWFGAATAALLMFAAPALAQTADQPGDASTTAQLSGDVEGEIGAAGDTDWFRLQVQQGQRYSLALAGVPNAEGAALDPMLSIYDAQGNQLAFNDDANESLNAALRYTPQQSGEVFVEARAFSEEATGRYRLGVSSEAVPADDAGGDNSTRARIAAGRSVSGEIEYEGDVDWYRFNARTGQRYRIGLAGSGDAALGDPFLRVVDRDGNELAMNDDGEESLNSLLEFVPAASGEVFIEARGYGDAYTGGYTLSVEAERMPTDDASGDRSTRRNLTVGGTVESTVGFQNDRDWYRVRLQEGQSYRFTLVSSGESPLSDPLLRLHNAQGEEVAMDDDGGEGFNSYLEYTATATGNYFIEASSFADASQGGYTLAAHAGDIPADATTDATLSTEGDYREGVLSPAGDSDWFRVDMTEGQGMRVGLTSAESADALGDPMLVIHGPDGQQIAMDDDGGEGLNSWLEFQATTAGAYYIEARGFAEDAAGRYALQLTPGEVGSSPDMAEYITAQSEGRTSLIGTVGDSDWYVLETIEGRPYRIYLDGAGEDALADPMLTIYDSQGTSIMTDDDGGMGLNSYITLVSPTGGPYFVGVSSFGDAATGRYALRVVDTDVPGHINTDEFLDASAADDRASRIDMAGDLDNFSVNLEAGVRYEIEVIGVGEDRLADPFLAIMTGENTQVTSDDDSGDGRNARLRFTPESSGTYYIQASGLGGSIGTYQVRIVRQ